MPEDIVGDVFTLIDEVRNLNGEVFHLNGEPANPIDEGESLNGEVLHPTDEEKSLDREARHLIDGVQNLNGEVLHPIDEVLNLNGEVLPPDGELTGLRAGPTCACLPTQQRAFAPSILVHFCAARTGSRLRPWTQPIPRSRGREMRREPLQPERPGRTGALRIPVWLLLVTMLTLLPRDGRAQDTGVPLDPGRAAPRVGLLELLLRSKTSPAARGDFQLSLERGLRRGLRRIELIPPSAQPSTLPAELAGCRERLCLPELARQLGVQLLVLGETEEELGTYVTRLRVADSQDGSLRVERTFSCEICTLDEAATSLLQAGQELGEELSASPVLRQSGPRPATTRVRVASQPPGALLQLDGREVGSTPMELELVPGQYRFAVQEEGYLPSDRIIEVRATPLGVEFRLKPRPLLPAVTPPPAEASGSLSSTPPRSVSRAWAPLGLGLGLAGATVGAILLGLDGEPTCDGPLQQCPTLWDTRTPGVVITATGAALLAGAAVIFLLDGRRGQPAPGSSSVVAARFPGME